MRHLSCGSEVDAANVCCADADAPIHRAETVPGICRSYQVRRACQTCKTVIPEAVCNCGGAGCAAKYNCGAASARNRTDRPGNAEGGVGSRSKIQSCDVGSVDRYSLGSGAERVTPVAGSNRKIPVCHAGECVVAQAVCGARGARSSAERHRCSIATCCGTKRSRH